MTKKALPELKSDAEAERWVDEADFSEYDFSTLRRGVLRFTSTESYFTLPLTLRRELYERAEALATAGGVEVGRYLAELLERALYDLQPEPEAVAELA